jgi:lysophospholipase L1-like esterase
VRVSAVVAGVAALAVALAAIASADDAAKPFSAYPSCGIKGKHGARFCFTGDHSVAVFRAFGRADVPYEVCARKRGERRHCAKRRTNNPGQRSRTRIDLDGAGRYELAWFEGGRAVDRDRLVVRRRAALIVGDSLSEGTKPYLPRVLSDWKVEQSVSTSRHAPEGVAILRRRGNLPGAVIFALGTNDDPHTVSAFSDALEAALSMAGKARCLVVPNIVRPPVGGASYAGYNRVIAELDRREKNFREVDWAKLVSRHRGWLAADGAHVTAEGYQARARAIAKQVERC